MKIVFAVIAVVVTMVATIKLVGNYKQHEEWEQSRNTTTICVADNDTLWDIAEMYKPSWMDTREYIHEVKTLNHKSSSSVYAGEMLTVYTMSTAIADSRYTMYGYYDNGIVVTEDGNAWSYDAQLGNNTSVIVVLSDNTTPNDIYDDVIINILED
jgi:hypothetical protein